MDNKVKSELMMQAASKVHEAWCERELKAFYERLYEIVGKKELSADALDKACYKGDQRRNEFVVEDANFLMSHPFFISNCLQSYEGFKKVLEYVTVMRFTKRKLTATEVKNARRNYNLQTGEENILRPFNKLSVDSQKENLSAAVSAVTVYEAFMKRGATIEQLKQEDMREAIGTLIHADWMRRNPKTSSNSYLYVPYAELGDWEKQQDLDVFFAMLEIVENNPEKYFVEKEVGLTPINVKGVEENVLKKVNAQKEIIC